MDASQDLVVPFFSLVFGCRHAVCGVCAHYVEGLLKLAIWVHDNNVSKFIQCTIYLHMCLLGHSLYSTLPEDVQVLKATDTAEGSQITDCSKSAST